MVAASAAADWTVPVAVALAWRAWPLFASAPRALAEPSSVPAEAARNPQARVRVPLPDKDGGMAGALRNLAAGPQSGGGTSSWTTAASPALPSVSVTVNAWPVETWAGAESPADSVAAVSIFTVVKADAETCSAELASLPATPALTCAAPARSARIVQRKLHCSPPLTDSTGGKTTGLVSAEAGLGAATRKGRGRPGVCDHSARL